MTKPFDRQLQQAIALHQSGQLGEAVSAYEKLVRRSPDAAGVFNLLGIAQFQLGNLPQAGVAMRRAVKLNPALPNAAFNLARIEQALGRYADALPLYETAVAASPNDLEALNGLGTALAALGRNADAIPIFQRAVALEPGFAGAWHNLGNCHKAENAYAAAVTAYENALARRPDHADTLQALALSLMSLNRQQEAVTHLRRALELQPDDLASHVSLGIALAALGQVDHAIDSFDQALALSPESPDALWNKALLLLANGRFDEGWGLFAHRWSAAAVGSAGLRPYTQPRWDGERVNGTLLIWGEQGVGDEILMSSMIPDLVGRADKIVLEVEPRLVELFSRSFAGVNVIPRGVAPYDGQITAQSSLGDLGIRLRPDRASFKTAAAGYLVADAERTKTLRQRLAGDGRRVIGISWVSKNRASGAAKSARLTDLLPLLHLPNCRFVDLQYGDTSEERAELARTHRIEVERVPDVDTMNDLDGLTALIAACDTVVTVSNTTAHVAGAQGKIGWVMLPHAFGRFWYWQHTGERSPFYDSLHLCRQAKDQPWSDVVAAIAPDVDAYLKR